MELLEYARNFYSQNGEDGIIERIFDIIGTTSKYCCEFGAWDGVRLSNTRLLLLSGWKGCLIEANPERFTELKNNYNNIPGVTCICSIVDEQTNTIEGILEKNNVTERLDFLSIDIDGLDYYVFKNLKIRPRLICIEVNAGHFPESSQLIDYAIAKNNIGQSLYRFNEVANRIGYRLICYSGNAFFLREDVGFEKDIRSLTALEAYYQFISHLNPEEKRWLYLVNIGMAMPYFNFRNTYLSSKNLSISKKRKFWIIGKGLLRKLFHEIRG